MTGPGYYRRRDACSAVDVRWFSKRQTGRGAGGDAG